MTTTLWIKARASGGGSNCVEVRRREDEIEVRDSKDPDGPMLRFSFAEMAAWFDGVRNGEFDHLLVWSDDSQPETGHPSRRTPAAQPR